MKRRREVNSHMTSPWTARLGHGGSSTGDINIPLPLDLTVEILKKLPEKSLVRFRCVSKQWSSIISRRKDFIESIVTRSSTQLPRDAHLLFEIVCSRETEQCSIVLSSSRCPRKTDKESLLSIPEGTYDFVRGLILCWSDFRNKAAIYNPTTRQSFQLPEMETMGSCFFGYDPLENQYKVLFIPLYNMEQGCQVFTLGAKQWRTIRGVESQHPLFGAVCINGAIYYIARAEDCDYAFLYKLMVFDVRSEKFYHVDAPETLLDHVSSLIDYQGKLGFVCCNKGLEIWVREGGDHKTQSWSKLFFYEMVGFQNWRVSGVTRDGEIVFTDWIYQPDDILCVLYYDPKQNSVRDVDFDPVGISVTMVFLSGLFRIMSKTQCFCISLEFSKGTCASSLLIYMVKIF